jgi:hypothetical protein
MNLLEYSKLIELETILQYQIQSLEHVRLHQKILFNILNEILTKISIICNKSEKLEILNLFNKNVLNKEIILESGDENHDGKIGHWLETQMNLKHNSDNKPDINGYELKTGNTKITLIDKVPDEMYYNGDILPKKNKKLKTQFWNFYGSKKKSDAITIGGWSINKFNECGQKLIFDDADNICILYDYNEDNRINKNENQSINKKPHHIMKWYKNTLKKTFDAKFNQNGFIICKMEENKFNKICFGNPIKFDVIYNAIKTGKIIHDGYSSLIGRQRHPFRSSNSFYDIFITEEY